MTKDDLEGLKAPISMVCVGQRHHCPCYIFSPLTLINLEHDPLFPDEIRVSGQKYLEEQKVEHEMRLYPEAPHGKMK